MLCIGCFECMHVCPEHAIDIDWETEIPVFMERMVEYAYGAVKEKKGKVGYMNFLIRITPDCDCFPFSDAPIVPDIGILASKDPVAIDAASFDLVNQQTGVYRFASYRPSSQRRGQVQRCPCPDGWIPADTVRRRDWDGQLAHMI